MKKSLVAIACMAALAVLLTVQSAPAQGNIEGVWKATEVIWSGDNPVKMTISPTHPNLFIVTKKHWSLTNIAAATAARPDLPQQGATDAQKVAVWTPFVGYAGTYEVKGNMVTSRTIVAKNPGEMLQGNFTTSEFKVEGNTLTLTGKTNQDGPIANPMTTKMVRVE
jgi:hypothetical protein